MSETAGWKRGTILFETFYQSMTILTISSMKYFELLCLVFTEFQGQFDLEKGLSNFQDIQAFSKIVYVLGNNKQIND